MRESSNFGEGLKYSSRSGRMMCRHTDDVEKYISSVKLGLSLYEWRMDKCDYKYK